MRESVICVWKCNEIVGDKSQRHFTVYLHMTIGSERASSSDSSAGGVICLQTKASARRNKYNKARKLTPSSKAI